MTASVNTFRQAFPAFDDDQKYPPQEITYWLSFAAKMHNADRWGDLLDDGLYLFVAHNLTLEAQAQAAASAGQVPGQVRGAITSMSVDKVSWSANPGEAMDPGAGHWNLSTYGLRWRSLQRMVGAGGIQLGVNPLGSGPVGAWPGPFPYGSLY